MADSINEEPICYYSLLGISKTASISEIRRAYRKLAMKWHPDRWTRNPALAAEAKQRFQQIQEAYSVLSNESKRSIYDAGLFDPLEEEDEGFYDFMQEMLAMMESVRPEVEQRGNCLEEELQRMFMEMTSNKRTRVYDEDDDLPVNKRTRVSYNQDVCV